MNNDTNKPSSTTTYAVFMVGIASFLYIYEFFLRVTPGVIIHELYQDFNIEAGTFGLISAFFYLGYTPMQIVAGVLTDHYGPKRLLILASISCSIAIASFSLTTSVIIAALSRLIIGIASSFGYICPLVITRFWLKPVYFSMAAGMIQMLGCLGAIIGGAPVRYLTDQIGWRSMSMYSAYAGLALAVLFWLFIKERPTHKQQNKRPKFSLKQEQQRLYQVAIHPQTIWISSLGFCFWAPMAVFAENLGPSYLMTLTGDSSHMVNTMLINTWIGVAIGGPIIGGLSAKLRLRKQPIIIALIVSCAASIGLIIYGQSLTAQILSILLFMFGLGASAQCVTFGLISDHQPASLIGTAVGLINLSVIMGGSTLLPFCSWIIELLGHGNWQSGMLIYPLKNYQIALMLMPVVSCIGILICIFKIKETHCQAQYQ